MLVVFLVIEWVLMGLDLGDGKFGLTDFVCVSEQCFDIKVYFLISCTVNFCIFNWKGSIFTIDCLHGRQLLSGSVFISDFSRLSCASLPAAALAFLNVDKLMLAVALVVSMDADVVPVNSGFICLLTLASNNCCVSGSLPLTVPKMFRGGGLSFNLKKSQSQDRPDVYHTI